MTNIYNPSHPGETLKEDVLPALGLNVTEAAEQLGVARPTLSKVLNGQSGISSEMALRLEAWLGVENGGRADLWVAQQAAYDLWKARQQAKLKVKRVSLQAA
jgi:antitoxin HigA-1